METSCLKNKNVSDAFETLIEITHREALQNKDRNNHDDNISITKTQFKKEKSKLCCF